jgi:hypothetical protein
MPRGITGMPDELGELLDLVNQGKLFGLEEDIKYFECPITTPVQPVEEMCTTAWQFLENRLKNPGQISMCRSETSAHYPRVLFSGAALE